MEAAKLLVAKYILPIHYGKFNHPPYYMETIVSGDWHFYNKIEGKIYDLTISQFDSLQEIHYMHVPSSREEAFLDTNENQYNYLKQRVMDID